MTNDHNEKTGNKSPGKFVSIKYTEPLFVNVIITLNLMYVFIATLGSNVNFKKLLSTLFV